MADRWNYRQEAMKRAIQRLSLLAFLVAAFIFVLLYPGSRGKPTANARDFSKTNTVTILLGEAATEYGDGLQHIHFEIDGLTTTT